MISSFGLPLVLAAFVLPSQWYTVVANFHYDPRHQYEVGQRRGTRVHVPGRSVRSISAGTVRFSGWVAGRGVVTVATHSGGNDVIVTYTGVVPSVQVGRRVRFGSLLGSFGDNRHLSSTLNIGMYDTRDRDRYLPIRGRDAPIGVAVARRLEAAILGDAQLSPPPSPLGSISQVTLGTARSGASGVHNASANHGARGSQRGTANNSARIPAFSTHQIGILRVGAAYAQLAAYRPVLQVAVPTLARKLERGQFAGVGNVGAGVGNEDPGNVGFGTVTLNPVEDRLPVRGLTHVNYRSQRVGSSQLGMPAGDGKGERFDTGTGTTIDRNAPNQYLRSKRLRTAMAILGLLAGALALRSIRRRRRGRHLSLAADGDALRGRTGVQFRFADDTDLLAHEQFQVLCLITEHALLNGFRQDDFVTLDVNLEFVPLRNRKSLSDFDWDHNPSQFINMSDNAGVFHVKSPV